EAEPGESPPEVTTVRRSAHLGDLAESEVNGRVVWPGWVVRGRLNLLSSGPKLGKTHLMPDPARRFWVGEPPPGRPATPFPPRTSTLWVCGGRRQNELRAHGRALGLPDEAVRLNARPSNPYGGWDLDNPDNVVLLRELVHADQPGLVIVDTVGDATRWHL